MALHYRYHGKYFCEVPLGLYIVRGDSVLLIGELVRPQPNRHEHNMHAAAAVAGRIKGRALYV